MTTQERRQRINNLRYHVALDIEDETDYTYDEVFQFLEKNKVYEDWEDWDLYNRPINIDNIIDCMDNDY